MWKRYETSLKSTRSGKENSVDDGEPQASATELDGLIDTAHTAKRLRSRGVATDEEPEMKQRPSKYIATLRDKTFGTPRRKVACRRSLRLDRLRSSTAPAAEAEEGAPAGDQSTRDIAQLHALEEEEICEVQSDPIQPTEGPSLDDVEEALSSPMSEKLVEADCMLHERPKIFRLEGLEHHWSEPEIIEDAQDMPGKRVEEDPTQIQRLDTHVGLETVTDVHPAPANRKGPNEESSNISPSSHRRPVSDAITPSSESNVVILSPPEDTKSSNTGDTAITPHANRDEEADRASDMNSISTSASHDEVSTGDQTLEHDGENIQSGSPKETRARTRTPRNSRRSSAKVEQEVMNPFAAQHNVVGAVATEMTELDTEQSTDKLTSNTRQARSGSGTGSMTRSGEQSISSEQPAEQEHRYTAQMGNETDMSGHPGFVVIKQPSTPEMKSKKPHASTVGAVFDEVKVINSEIQTISSPRKSTRSGTRFSDDTSMLKDFLNRAQARKLAKGTTIKADAPAESTSPRRSPRKALANLDRNSPSPHKAREVASRAGTPPGKVKLGEVQQEDVEDTIGDASPVRRSGRKRLLGSAKPATGGPSFIPVRRADGTDPVVLQKSVAQELALVTRSNTRRNKGQAKPPAMILKNLIIEEVGDETRGGHALRSCKSVDWDKKLVYYQDGMESRVDGETVVEEKRPKARRLRGLGTGNGTPAPKRITADVLSSSGTPATKRHGRVR